MAETVIAPSGGGSGSGGAPTTVEYLVGAADGGLSAERVVTNTDSILWDLGTGGQAKANAASRVYARSTGFSYDTSSTETSIFSFSALANDLGTDKSMLVKLYGNLLSNSGTNTLQVSIKLGATTLWGDISGTITNSATRRPWSLEFVLANGGAANVQEMVGYLLIGSVGAASVAGLGEIAVPGTAFILSASFRGTAAEDTTANKTVDVTWKWAVSNAANQLVLDSGIAILL